MKLKILFTSDLHGYFFPTDYIHAGYQPMGVNALAGMFRAARDEATLTIDGGDTLQGSPLAYYAAHHGKIPLLAQAMNDAGYDYVTVGNHDFNYGYAALSGYLNALNARVLAANVDDLGGEMPFFPSDVRVLPNGLRVGIVGAVTDWVNRWEKPANLTRLRVNDTLSAVQRAYESIRNQCDVTVCVYHGGVEKDLETGRVYSSSGENLACRIAETCPFDILLTGHQHLAIPSGKWMRSHIVQTPANAPCYAEVVWEDGRISSRLVYAEGKGTPSDAFSALENEVEAWLDTPISRLNRALTPEEPLCMALHGSPIANLFNRVQTQASGCGVSCTSLANRVRGFAENVTVRDVVSTYVYPNTLVLLRVTGAQLKAAMENCASYFEIDADGHVTVSEKFLKPKVSHYNFDYYSGVEYRFELSMPVGSRVVELRRNGQPVRPEDELTLCVNNYRATGVGGYDVLRTCPHEKELLTEMSEILLDFFAANPLVTVDEASPYRVTYRGKTVSGGSVHEAEPQQ